MADPVNTNTKKVTKLEWTSGGANIAIGDYSGSAGPHPLLVANVSSEAVAALAAFLASGASLLLLITLAADPQIVPGTGYYQADWGGRLQIGS